MAYQDLFHQAEAALQSQHLISFAGGSNMLGATTSDSSYRSFAAAADGTYRTQALPSSKNSSQVMGSRLSVGYQEPPHLINNVQSPQPSLDSSFPGVPSPTDSSPDWLQQQSSAANDEGLVFSSSHQGCNPSHSHLPQLETQAQVMTYNASSQIYEHTGQELRQDSHYPYKKHAPFHSLGLLHEPPQLLVGNSSSGVSATQPCTSSGRLQSFGFYQSSPAVHSRESSHDGTPTVIISPTEGMGDIVSDISMLNSPNGSQDDLFRDPFADFHQSPTLVQAALADIKAIGSASFDLPTYAQSSPSVDASGSYTSSDAASSITTFLPLEDKGKGKLLQVPSSQHSRRPSDPSPVPLGGSRSQLPGRSPSTRSSRRRSSSGQVPLLPRPLPDNSGSVDRSSVSNPAICLPKKSRGKRSKPLDSNKRQLATMRRNERTVCIGCKMAKVTLLGSIYDLRKFYDTIRVSEGHQVLYELNLHTCWAYINSNCSPVSHPFQQFIDGLKVQRQDGWRTCIRDNTNKLLDKQNLCDVLLAWDDMAPWVTYALIPKDDNPPYSSPNDGTGTVLGPDNAVHEQMIIVAAQISRIIGRKLELQFYDYLKKALTNPNIYRKLVLDVGRTIMSLRRRLAPWTQNWANTAFSALGQSEAYVGNDSGNDDSLLGSSVDRIKNLCQILYVYFCYMRRRLSPGDQQMMQTMEVQYPGNEQTVEESFPQYESIDGFEEWLQFKDQPIS
ncbi:hypothetical protein TARUN_5680 [Trichoderma arundinaceum]|uniref:Uncharacterized protein n=1 Tax=Trichoderma arundinaceum TaxID=490622 RepID=A0A395NKY7_TRIAR|nr:hypothetical protein TARUN_5680 [Trichoderma arundinaceum]